MASIHFALGKPNLACYYLKVAIDENKKAVESLQTTETTETKSQPSLHALNKSKHYELMYSLGVGFLYAGQAAKAFDCFIEAVQQYHNEPRLWLRMAECCIICHKPVSLKKKKIYSCYNHLFKTLSFYYIFMIVE